MPRIERTIEIERPPEEIWPRVSLEKFPEWIDFFKRVEWTSKAKDKTGATARVTVEIWGEKVDSNMEMTEVVKNERRVWLAADENMRTAGLVVLSPTKSGTKVIVVMNYDFPKSEFGKLTSTMFTIFSKKIEKDVEKGLKKLKNALEKQATPTL